jgi:hypothetical protein
MILCAAGDIHGALNRLYEDVLSFEKALGARFEWVLHVGDFGVWPDPTQVHKATKRHDGAGDFPSWFATKRAAPRKTLFIKGNHEGFAWLDAQPGSEVLPGLFYLRNGQTFDLAGEGTESIRVGGIGGCYGPKNYGGPSAELRGYSKRHYTRDEIETLAASSIVDIVLTHDAPAAGVKFERHRQGAGDVSESAGLDLVLQRVQPRVCFFGHHHTRLDAEVAGVRCIGLNKVAMPGNLVAIEMKSGVREWNVLGEWPPRRAAGPPTR